MWPDVLKIPFQMLRNKAIIIIMIQIHSTANVIFMPQKISIYSGYSLAMFQRDSFRNGSNLVLKKVHFCTSGHICRIICTCLSKMMEFRAAWI